MARSCKLNDSILRHIVLKQPKTLFDAMVARLEGDPSAYGHESEPVRESETAEAPRRR